MLSCSTLRIYLVICLATDILVSMVALTRPLTARMARSVAKVIRLILVIGNDYVCSVVSVWSYSD